MIWNPGHLPQGWSIDSLLQKHSSHPINPEIANAFFRAGMIESWGLGTERIVDYCRQNHSPKPSFRIDPTSLWVEFPYPSIHRPNQKTIQKTTQKTIQMTGENTQAAKILGITRPRVSDLIRKKTIKFTIDALVDMLARDGKHVQVTVQ